MSRRRRAAAQPAPPGRARVLADGTRRTLLVDGLEASVVDLADPRHLEIPYTRWIAGVLEATAPGDVLHLGGGACTLARWLAAVRPASRSRVLEVDADVVRVAREQLGLDDVPGLRVSTADARAGVSSLRPRSFDAVVADVFVGPRVPDHLCTVEALADVRRVLRPGGVYVANLIDEAPLRRARRQVATVAEVFGPVTLIAERAVLGGRRAGNLVAAAGRTFARGPIGRAAKGADVLEGESAALWCGGARPLRD
ncbi:spermidine synthase [Capillimicrobium parvum]|uniref:Polyamine aminopropyltransferase n=1 Tax=Capillimicrobium parvum TaxID=2884022 RepID=A0A9E6XV84_9ACTN|nr:fused MFS/spermidine synthase [Capillimicrobium parvum]UGS35036.1 Polyamine aminopropyltransferase [Capillimicrobium parvum]